MKFKVASELRYRANTDGTIVINISALKTANQTVIQENLTLDPYIKVDELSTKYAESRLVRFEIDEPVDIQINYDALVDCVTKVKDYSKLKQTPVAKLHTSILPYLYPSRYCQSDKLYRLADNLFGKIQNPFDKVRALTDWIHANVLYQGGFSTSQTSAYDTVTEQIGVCRDFAHLGIALCRALTIPARYFTGYAYQLFPQDFHACFEAYLGGEWVLFDATKLVPLNGLVKIASGRDAADTAFANIFGDIIFKDISVSCEVAEDDFEPFYYLPEVYQGITYL